MTTLKNSIVPNCATNGVFWEAAWLYKWTCSLPGWLEASFECCSPMVSFFWRARWSFWRQSFFCEPTCFFAIFLVCLCGTIHTNSAVVASDTRMRRRTCWQNQKCSNDTGVFAAPKGLVTKWVRWLTNVGTVNLKSTFRRNSKLYLVTVFYKLR